MALDSDKAATGKDVTITVTFDGVTVKTYEHVGFEVEPVYETVTTSPLGTTQRYIDPILIGWKGSIEIEENRANTDEFLDLVHAAGEFRVPKEIVLVVTTKYRNLTTKRYAYPGVQITGAPRTVKRSEANKIRISWESGVNRIAA